MVNAECAEMSDQDLRSPDLPLASSSASSSSPSSTAPFPIKLLLNSVPSSSTSTPIRLPDSLRRNCPIPLRFNNMTIHQPKAQKEAEKEENGEEEEEKEEEEGEEDDDEYCGQLVMAEDEQMDMDMETTDEEEERMETEVKKDEEEEEERKPTRDAEGGGKHCQKRKEKEHPKREKQKEPEKDKVEDKDADSPKELEGPAEPAQSPRKKPKLRFKIIHHNPRCNPSPIDPRQGARKEVMADLPVPKWPKNDKMSKEKGKEEEGKAKGEQKVQSGGEERGKEELAQVGGTEEGQRRRTAEAEKEAMSKDPRQNPFRPNRPFGSQPSPPLMQQQPHPHRLQQHHNPINPAPFFHPQQNSPRLRLPLHQNQGGISRSSLDSGHDSLPQTPQQEPSCTVFPPQSPLMYPFPSPNSMTSPCGSASGAFNPLGSLTQAQELTALRKELDAKNDTIKSLEKSHSGFSKQIANLMAFKKEEKERNEQLKQESKEKDVEIQRLNGEASRLNDALLAGREREKNLEQRVESQKKNLERNQKMRYSQTAEQEKKEAEMGQMRKENSKLKTEVEQIERKMEQMRTEKEQMKKEMEKTREEKNNLKAEKEQMKREMEKTREEKNNLKAEKEQTKREMGKIRSELKKKQEQIEELNRQNSSNEQQMELHKMELGQLEQKHKQNLKRQKTELDLKKAQELQELEVQKAAELQKVRAELLAMQRKGGVERCPRCESNDMREVLDVYKETMKECYRRHKCGVCGPIVREDPSGGSAASTIRAHSPPPRPATNVSRHKRNADNTPNEVAKKQCRNSDPQSMTSTPSHSSFPSTSNFNDVSGFVNALHNQQNVRKEDGRMPKKELMLRTSGVGGGGRANCAENNREEEEDDDEIQVLEEERPPTSNSIRTPSTANSEVLPTLFANNQSNPQTDEKYNGENILREIETGIQADNPQMTIIMQEKRADMREENSVLAAQFQKRSAQKVEVDTVEGSRTQRQAMHSRTLVPPPPQPTPQLSGTPSQQTSSNSAASASASSQQQQTVPSRSSKNRTFNIALEVLQKRLDRIQQEANEQPQQRDIPQHGASANTLSHPQVEHRRNNIMSQQQQQQQQMQQQNWQGQLQQQQRGQPNQHQMSQQLQSQPLARLPQQTPMDPNAFNLSSSQPRPQQQPMFGVTLTSQESWFPMQQPQSQQYQQQQQQVAPAVHPVTAAFQQQLMMSQSQFIPNVQYPTPPFQQTSQPQQYLQPQQPQQQSAIGGQDPIGQLRQMFLHLPPRQQ